MANSARIHRTITIHNLNVQNREQSEELKDAQHTLAEIGNKVRRVKSAPTLIKRSVLSDELLTQLEECTPTIRSPEYQRELNIIVDMIKEERHPKHPKTVNRLEQLLETDTELIPTITEVINIICRTETITDVVKYIINIDPLVWNETAARAIIYNGDKTRPQALIFAYMICDKLLDNESPDTVLREENLISRFVTAWITPIKFSINDTSVKKIACSMLKASFRHLMSTCTDFHQNLQQQIYEKGLQVENDTPIMYINVFLRFYIPQFTQQSQYNRDTTVNVSRLVQSYINSILPPKVSVTDMTYLHHNNTLQQLTVSAKQLFK